MRKLVKYRNGAALTQRLCNLGTEHIGFKIGYAPCVFHSTRIEFGDEELIVLLERIRRLELLLIKLETLASQLKNIVRIYIGHQRFTRVNTQRNNTPLRIRQFARNLLIRARHDGCNVRRHARSRLEIPCLRPTAAAVLGLNLHLGLVRNHNPVRRNTHAELKLGLQIWLLKYRENTARIRNLEL